MKVNIKGKGWVSKKLSFVGVSFFENLSQPSQIFVI